MKFLKTFLGSKKNISTLENDISNAIEILRKFERTAFVPKLKDTKSKFSKSSKIHGFPYLRSETDWPICPNCNKNMQLFLQLDLTAIPTNQSEDLIQLFYCTSSEPYCESDLESFLPFSKGAVVRRIKIDGSSKEIKPKIDEIFDEQEIIAWEEIKDYPHPEEYQELGISFNNEDEVLELLEERNISQCLEGDKVFGWPYWVQSVEYPFDRKTKTKMELLFQIDSDRNLSYMFGDAGIGHITKSPVDEDELAFGWACS